MIKTPNLDLPIYDKPDTDTFKVADWNKANENIDYVFGEFKNNPNVNAIDIKAREDIIKTNEQLETKANKGDSISVSQIDKNKGKIDQTYLTDELLQQITGDTPINAVLADGSLTSIKVANKSINANKMNFLNCRIKDVQLKSGLNTDGKRSYNETLNTTSFIAMDRTKNLKIYQFNTLNFYDSSRTLISGIKGSTSANRVITSATIPTNATYIRVCYLIENDDYMYINQDGELLEYEMIIKEDKKYISELEKDIKSASDSSFNLFNENSATNIYVNEYGVEVDYASYKTSDYIEVFDGTYTSSANGFCAYYDENKNFIFSERHTSGNKLKWNDTIRYVRVGFANISSVKYVVKGDYVSITNEYSLNPRFTNAIKNAIEMDEIKLKNIVNTNNILTKSNIYTVDDTYLRTDLLKYNKNYTSVKYSYRLLSKINYYDVNKRFLGYSTAGNNPMDFSQTSILAQVEYLEFIISKQYYDNDSYVTWGNENVFYNYKKTPTVTEPNFITYLDRFDLDCKSWRIPFVGVTKNATILAGGEARYESSSDFSNCQIAIARSTDFGKTWQNKQIVIPRSGIGSKSRSMCGTILPTKQGRVYLLGSLLEEGEWQHPIQTTQNDWDLVLYYSDDDGVTWNFKRSLKADVLKNSQVYTAIASVGNGIEMIDGTLVFCLPVSKKMQVADDRWADTSTALLYSKDFGETWTISSSLTPETMATECTLVELSKGNILINTRRENLEGRSIYTTTDLGATWTPHATNNLPEAVNYNPMLKINYKAVDIVIYGHNAHDRSKCTIRVLCGNKKWISVDRTLPMDDWQTGYSCFAFDKTNNKLYWAFERGILNFRDISYLLEDIYKTYISYTDLLTD